MEVKCKCGNDLVKWGIKYEEMVYGGSVKEYVMCRYCGEKYLFEELAKRIGVS